MTKEKYRLGWIDCMKGIGIILVVLGHIYKDNLVNIWVYSFHMPLFFIISGYLSGIKDQDQFSFKLNFVHKTKTLLYPFIFFRCFLFIYWFCIEYKFRQLDLGPIWFIFSLYIVSITIIPLLIRLNKLNQKLFLTGWVILAYYIFLKILPYNDITHWLIIILGSSLWVSIGHCIGVIQQNQSIKWGGFLTSLLLTISLLLSFTNGSVSLYSGQVNNYVIYLLESLAGTMFVACLCKQYLKHNKFIEYLGRYSIVILAIHEPIKRIIVFVLYKLCSIFSIQFTVVDVQNKLGIIVFVIVIYISIQAIKCFVYLRYNTGVYGKYILNFIK